MPPRLILNADDFGLTEGINRAIVDLYRERALTSATLMATAPAVDHAIMAALANPTLGVGCHIVLVDGLPSSPPAEIATLLGPDRRTFHPSLATFAQAVLRGDIRHKEIVREGLAQVRRLQQAGIHVTHLDTHKHTHAFPSITRAVLQVAEECGVRAIRNPFEPRWASALPHGTLMRRTSVWLMRQIFRQEFQQSLRRTPGIATTDGTIGIAATGALDGKILRDLLRAMPSTGTWELVLHPGYFDQALQDTATRLRATRDVERNALLECIPTLQPGTARLIHYGTL